MKNFTFKIGLKPLTRVLVLLVFQVVGCAAPAASPEQALFARPLIVGASVSGDTGTASPGKRIALKYTRKKDIHVVARGGAPGRDVIREVSDERLANRTIIVALDFLFWDASIPGSPEPSISALQSLIDRAQQRKIPLVLGDVPNLLPGALTARDALNSAIYERCKPSRQCYIVGLDNLHQQIVRDGFLEIKGRKYRMSEILPDGLHLSSKASEEIADRLLKKLKEHTTTV